MTHSTMKGKDQKEALKEAVKEVVKASREGQSATTESSPISLESALRLRTA